MSFDLHWQREPTDDEAAPWRIAQARVTELVETRESYSKLMIGHSAIELRRMERDPERSGEAKHLWNQYRQLFAEDAHAVSLQREVESACDALEVSRRWYFGCNNWSMSMLREFAERHEMMSHPEWGGSDDHPTRAEFGLPENEEGSVEQEDAYSAAWDERVLGEVPEPVTGIPWMKLGDNSGWWVKPVEIRAALAAYKRTRTPHFDWVFRQRHWREFDEHIAKINAEQPPEQQSELVKAVKLYKPESVERQDASPEEQDSNRLFFEQWISFLVGAADHDGFRVY